MSDTLLEPEDQIAMCECGQLDHAEQVRELPKGARVRAVTDIAQLGENVRTGTKGTVTGHCSDGRAIVFFEGHQYGHTFHTPNGYIEVVASGHQVTKSGTCVIPGCPCRGWSAQETATVPEIECQFCDFKGTFAEGAEHRKATQHLIRTVTVGELRRNQSSSEHQPAAQGGGERVKVELINGVEGQCIGVNDYRICGPKPWGGGSVAKSWTTDKNDVLRAFLTPDQKHVWLADDLEVVSVKQHQALVAERESHARLLIAAKFLLAMNATNYDRDVMRKEGGFDALQKAVDAIEQRSTPQ